VKKQKIYIGVVGQIASGKEVFAEYLIKKYGFCTFSLSTVLHQELTKRGVTQFTRKTLQDIGDEMRQKYGDAILAKRAIEILNNDKRSVVITGIRNPAEVKYFRTIKNFILAAVYAQRKVRFRRVLRRGKPWDPKTWKQFYKIDRRDFGIGQEKSGQQVGVCIKMADYTLTNNKDLESFYGKIEELILDLKAQISNP
jgi:dephospho-CoA kinase